MEKESIIEGLEAIKVYSEIELKAQGQDSSEAEFFISDAETVEKAISLIENPDSIRLMRKEDIDSLLGKLKDMEDYSKDELRGSESLGIVYSAWGNDVVALAGAREFIEEQYHAFHKGEENMSEIRSEVLTELDAPALLGGRFDLQAEVVSILEQGEEAYENLANTLREDGAQDVVEFLDKQERISAEYIDVDVDNAEFYGVNPATESVQFALPFSLDMEAIRRDMREQEQEFVSEAVDGKEIISVTRPKDVDAYCEFMVEYSQDGHRTGKALIPIDYLDTYEGDKTEDKAIVLDMLRDGTLTLPNLMERPHYSEVSPALLYLYDELHGFHDDVIFTEKHLADITEKEKKFQGMTPQDFLDQIEADMILYPSLAEYILIDPYEDKVRDIEFFYTFSESIAESCPKTRDNKHLPVHNDIPGEEIFKEIETALKTVENEVGEDLSLKDAMQYCSSISAHDVLLSLKKEAESPRGIRGCTVLFGTMKYENQKDRQDAYKWAKKWINKPAKRLNYELWKKQERDKGQGK